MGWRAGHKSVLLPVAGEVFLLTLPFIERRYRRSRQKNQMSGSATNRDLPLHCEFLSRGRRARSDFREASLKQHFEFDDIRTHHAGTIQDPALHLEMADTMLVDELSKIF
jgi:hypothetical protein